MHIEGYQIIFIVLTCVWTAVATVKKDLSHSANTTSVGFDFKGTHYNSAGKIFNVPYFNALACLLWLKLHLIRNRCCFCRYAFNNCFMLYISYRAWLSSHVANLLKGYLRYVCVWHTLLWSRSICGTAWVFAFVWPVQQWTHCAPIGSGLNGFSCRYVFYHKWVFPFPWEILLIFVVYQSFVNHTRAMFFMWNNCEWCTLGAALFQNYLPRGRLYWYRFNGPSEFT